MDLKINWWFFVEEEKRNLMVVLFLCGVVKVDRKLREKVANGGGYGGEKEEAFSVILFSRERRKRKRNRLSKGFLFH